MADPQGLIELTADVVAAHVSNNKIAVGDVATLVANVHAALAGLGAPAPEPAPEVKTPAVSLRSSVKPDTITCLQCGSKQKMLKRHLQTAHGITPDVYRRQFGLPASYPMVAPNYAQFRSELAKKAGLGSGRGSKASSVHEPAPEQPAESEQIHGDAASPPSPEPSSAEQPKQAKRRRKAPAAPAEGSADQPNRRPRSRPSES